MKDIYLIFWYNSYYFTEETTMNRLWDYGCKVHLNLPAQLYLKVYMWPSLIKASFPSDSYLYTKFIFRYFSILILMIPNFVR